MSNRFRKLESGVARCCCCDTLTRIDPGKSVTLCAVCREQGACREQEEFMEFVLGHPVESPDTSEGSSEILEPVSEVDARAIPAGIFSLA